MMKRTHDCGALRASNENQEVVLAGWVAARRDHGGLLFLDLRDRSGSCQLQVSPEHMDKKAMAVAESLRLEYVIAVKGTVALRGEKNRNPKLPTGDIEVLAADIEVLNTSEPSPFLISESGKDAGEVSEETRLTYRYLDLRRPSMAKNLQVRHVVTSTIRRVLDERGFWDIETPILTKSTPEGARDYIVPSRKYPGTFFALPQSPQQFKQMLQTAGVEKYYQIARCFRDEDSRGDRQPEFTQLDIEMSFVDEEDIITIAEELVAAIIRATKGLEVELPIERITFAEAMARTGRDAPDFRFGLELVDVSKLCEKTDFKVFSGAAKKKGQSVRGIRAPGAASRFSRKQIEALETELKAQYPAVKGLAWYKLDKGKATGAIGKFVAGEFGDALNGALEMQDGDLAFFLAGEDDTVFAGLGALRLKLGRKLELIPADTYRFVWVLDFPMFEYSAEEDRHVARHHPFTQPRPEHMKWVAKEPGRVIARAYDLVLNGVELAGGSIRIHDAAMQQKVFAALGIDADEAEARFGHLLRALRMGTPPHGGIAMGLDRAIMLLQGLSTIRDVIAFPKTLQSKCLLTEAPSPVEQKQLDELGIAVTAEPAGDDTE